MRWLNWVACALLFFSWPAMAIDSNNCTEQSAKIKSTSKRNAFLKSCLERVNSPANMKALEKHRKKVACELNVKNMKLTGKSKISYLEKCLNENEAQRRKVACELNAKNLKVVGKSKVSHLDECMNQDEAQPNKTVRKKTSNAAPKPVPVKSKKKDESWSDKLRGLL